MTFEVSDFSVLILKVRRNFSKPLICINPIEREFFVGNLLVRIHLIIDIIWLTGLAPWKFPFPGSRISTFLVPFRLSLSGGGWGGASVAPCARTPSHLSFEDVDVWVLTFEGEPRLPQAADLHQPQVPPPPGGLHLQPRGIHAVSPQIIRNH